MAKKINPAKELFSSIGNIGSDLIKTTTRQKTPDTRKASCEASGGVWDPVSETCIRKPKEEETKTTPKAKLTTPETFTDPRTGRASGIVLPDGRTFLGLSPQDVNQIAAGEAARVARPAGTQPVGTQQSQIEMQNQLNNLQPMATGNIRELFPQENLISQGATGAAAVGGAVFGAKTGAAAGAALGTAVPVIGNIAGAIGGAVIGGAVGAVGGAYTKVSIQKRQSVKEATKVFSQAKTNKNEILNMVNAGLLSEGQARGLWQEEKQNIASAHAYLFRQSQNDLDAFLGSPGDELIQVESYLALDTQYDLEFEKSLLQPNPLKIRYQDTGVVE